MTLVAGLVACAASRVYAQQTPASPPTFGSGITLIQVDASVLDADGQPVRGLQASDFTILEDGVPQDIQSFTAIDIPAALPVAHSTRQVASDVKDNATAADHRIVVIVLDDLQIPTHLTSRAREVGRRLIEGLGPGDQAAIVFTRINSAAQDFTDDHARLLAAVERFAGSLSGDDPLSHRDSLGVLEKVSRSLVEIPRRRTAIVFVSVGVFLPRGLRDDLYRYVQRSNVNVYPIDPSYLGALGIDTNRQDSLRALAENTGGLAIIGRNDLGPGVRQVLQDIGSYYLLGYQPSSAKPDSEARRVTVKVRRPGMTVRSRAGYYWVRTDTPARAAPTSELDRALGGLMPSRDIRMRAAAAPFAAIGRPGATVALVVALTQSPGTEGSRVKEQIDLAVSAYDIDGRVKASKRDGFNLTLRPSSDEVAYEILSELDVKPGRYQLRIAAHNMAQGKAGSVFYDLEVPDFSKGRVTLSGLVLSATPAHPMATPDRLASLLPVVPTTLRAFTTSTRVEAFVRVYQNDKAPSPVALSASLTNAEGGVVFDATESLAADRFVGRAADYRIELPVSGLAPGPYLLRLEAKTPKQATAGRAVPFTIGQ